jgi:hypothetical protein
VRAEQGRFAVKKGLWTSDFILQDGVVLVKKTGHRFAFDLKLWHDIVTWSAFYVRAELWRLQRRLSGHRRARIAFLPDLPRPWYLIWAVAACAGARVVDDARQADIIVHFDDSTVSAETPLPDFGARPPRLVNFCCRDISKSLVASAFERVAGYALAVDPSAYSGPIVDKSEINAAHDGHIVEGPFPPRPGRAYQRLIDNAVEGGLVEDLRTVTAGGEALLVFRKRRPIARRFANENVSCDWVKAGEVYSEAELDLIRRFTRELKLDWGGIDVLRNRADGRIYIVDANKTDMGPPAILTLGQKLRATRFITRGFMNHLSP